MNFPKNNFELTFTSLPAAPQTPFLAAAVEILRADRSADTEPQMIITDVVTATDCAGYQGLRKRSAAA
jgi:hypothetical protein